MIHPYTPLHVLNRVVFYTYQSDLGDGWEDADVHDDAPDIRESALRMGVNLYLYVLSQMVP